MQTRISGPILIIGASHQGEVVLDLLRSLPDPPRVVGFLDSGPEGHFIGKTIGGVPVLDGIQSIARYREQIEGAVPAIGDGAIREEIVAILTREEVPLLSAVHPSAILALNVQVDAGAVVHAGTVIGVGVRVGLAAIVNSGAVVEHHGRIGDYAHVAPGARLAGGVRVGERAWVGNHDVVNARQLRVEDDALKRYTCVSHISIPYATGNDVGQTITVNVQRRCAYV